METLRAFSADQKRRRQDCAKEILTQRLLHRRKSEEKKEKVAPSSNMCDILKNAVRLISRLPEAEKKDLLIQVNRLTQAPRHQRTQTIRTQGYSSNTREQVSTLLTSSRTSVNIAGLELAKMMSIKAATDPPTFKAKDDRGLFRANFAKRAMTLNAAGMLASGIKFKRGLTRKETVKYYMPIRTRLEKLWLALLKMRKMRLTPREVAHEKVFSHTPYEHPYSEQFFLIVKLGDVKAIASYITYNRYLVHDFDPVRQTVLHWATRRNYLEITEMLLKAGANVDATDMMGRTPLFFAAKNSFVDMVKLLISYEADPFLASKKGETPHNATNHQYIKMYIKKAQLVYEIISSA